MTKKNCAFTIVAKNYVGLACTLCDSFLQNNPESDFHIFIADEISSELEESGYNIHEAKSKLGLPVEVWNDLSFKYNLTEFCTAIKPKTFQYLLESYNKVVYLDPDIFVYSSLKYVFDKLDQYEVIISPHYLKMEKTYNGDLWENIFLGMGSFNLGFLAVKESADTNLLLNWWDRVLRTECFMDSSRYTATDQKWFNYVPMFLSQDKLLITRHKGIDVAPWNFFEREIFVKNDKLLVKFRTEDKGNEEADELLFVHFSNYKYAELLNRVVNHYSLKKEYSDLNIIFTPYVEALIKGSLGKYISLPYTYNYYDDGTTISTFNRRLYRRLRLEGYDIINPFDSSGTFFQMLKKKRLITKQKAVTTTVRGVKNKKSKSSFESIIDHGMWVVKCLIGIDKYQSLCNYLHKRTLPENQTFLYDRKSKTNL